MNMNQIAFLCFDFTVFDSFFDADLQFLHTNNKANGSEKC